VETRESMMLRFLSQYPEFSRSWMLRIAADIKVAEQIYP
jgi:hypothetical protein